MKYKAVLKGTLISFCITLVVIIIIAALNCFFAISGEITRIVSLAGLAAGIVFSSFGVCSGCEKMKLFNALAIGVCCIIIIMLMSFLMRGGLSFNIKFLTACICCVVSSVLGAVLSV